ncbi:acetyl/propionyl/methylcrotonyl-CoA carboxylase subunit alpha [Ketobacter sp.]|uniref:acetyl/propionyl/methylcrotonyl-CoA carboxylase subunit alpha n=1 Tax=Ketobacter sp. TaxID=2083498 RepID=UPI000F27EAF9|nr:acetyl/propionyl/methylcrotonyl-CoA carboxylase subunit alpha [Ketobacter sp.]RLT93533.1 MAG: acetyl/propionyl/methylcrotonyl-CoA carboxylase subunit alpha [Ketobacter sp.]
MTEFKKILIANRGEIAVRVIATAKKMGYATVAVYSDADANALHVQQADEAVHIGPSAVAESYLNIDHIIQAAQVTGADAIHPGYGFLSENSAFAAACEANGICFIGPPSPAIELMGSKRQSKLAVEKAGVPTVPGYDGADQSLDTLAHEAERIQTPLMIKASAGGGGRGMRLVTDLSHIKSDLQSARSEAEHAFGSGELILEKAILSPRHIEVQVFADQFGHCVYLWERDCSVQRRHQKVVEEAPSPFLTAPMRKTMGEAAVKVAQLCNYVGAGTVEFLVDEAGAFYFLEMNTRLQVEHPVTEMITGLDLVEWQLRVASGEPLPLAQNQIQLNGHAIEVRLYAEDAYRNYLPQTGPVHVWQTEPECGIRIDSGVQSGSEISPFYDPMLAKIIAHAADRRTAIRKLDRALGNTVLLGTQTNRGFLRQLINHPAFNAGAATTAFIAAHQSEWQAPTAEAEQRNALIAAALLHSQQQTQNHHNKLGTASRLTLAATDTTYLCRASGADTITITCQEQVLQLQLEWQGCQARVSVLTPDQPTHSRHYHFLQQEENLYLDDGNQTFHYRNISHAASEKASRKGSGHVVAPMDGNLVSISVTVGSSVKQGDIVATVEAMKMEHQLRASVAGSVAEVRAQVGDQLKARQLILLINEENKANDSE